MLQTLNETLLKFSMVDCWQTSVIESNFVFFVFQPHLLPSLNLNLQCYMHRSRNLRKYFSFRNLFVQLIEYKYYV